MKILTMCRGGNSRSVGMAFLLKYKYNIDSLACGWEKNNPDTLEMLFNWADHILVMEDDFKKFIPEKFKNKLIVTDVGFDRWFSISKNLTDLCDSLIKDKLMNNVNRWIGNLTYCSCK